MGILGYVCIGFIILARLMLGLGRHMEDNEDLEGLTREELKEKVREMKKGKKEKHIIRFRDVRPTVTGWETVEIYE